MRRSKPQPARKDTMQEDGQKKLKPEASNQIPITVSGVVLPGVFPLSEAGRITISSYNTGYRDGWRAALEVIKEHISNVPEDIDFDGGIEEFSDDDMIDPWI